VALCIRKTLNKTNNQNTLKGRFSDWGRKRQDLQFKQLPGKWDQGFIDVNRGKKTSQEKNFEGKSS